MNSAVAAAVAKVAADGRGAWLAFEVFSRFGPVSHQLALATTSSPPTSPYQQLLATIRSYRHATLSTTSNIGVVAHRGTGPTNRTMGSLISNTDQRRVNWPAENSEEAFELALGQKSTGATPETAKLDGVECDVYLSSDGVAIVTHEHNFAEQLGALPQLHAPRRLVEKATAEELTQLFRKLGVAKSVFMTLDQLIALVAPVAGEYFEATGRPFRLEIEMKGSTKPEYEAGISPEAKARIGGVEGYLRKVVAKSVSQAKKGLPGLPIEFVLFNGSRDDVNAFSSCARPSCRSAM